MGPLLNLSVNGLSVGDFSRLLSRQTGLSVVVQEGLESREVVGEFVGVSVDDALGAVSRRIGCQIVRTGRMVYMGDLRPEDRGVMVRLVGRLTAAEIQSAIDPCLSEWGKVQAFADGLVVVSDRVEVIGRVNSLLDSIESAPAGGFVVQLYVLSLSNEARKNLGVDVVPMAEVAALVGNNGSSVDGKAGLAAALRATATSAAVRVVGRPLFLVADGASAKMRRGRRDPIPRKAVSSEGTVSTLEYSSVETGFLVDITCRRLDSSRVRLSVSVELSDVIGRVEDAPIVQTESGSGDMVLSLSSPALVMSLEREIVDRRNDGIFQLNPSKVDRGELLQVWAHVVGVN